MVYFFPVSLLANSGGDNSQHLDNVCMLDQCQRRQYTHPVFQFLKLRLKGSFGDFIKWLVLHYRLYFILPAIFSYYEFIRNFSKFLCDIAGSSVPPVVLWALLLVFISNILLCSYGPKDAPFSFEDDIRSLLGVDELVPRAKQASA